MGYECGILRVRGLQHNSVRFTDGLACLLRWPLPVSSAGPPNNRTKIAAARTRPRPQIRAAGASQLLPRASLRQPR